MNSPARDRAVCTCSGAGHWKKVSVTTLGCGCHPRPRPSHEAKWRGSGDEDRGELEGVSLAMDGRTEINQSHKQAATLKVLYNNLFYSRLHDLSGVEFQLTTTESNVTWGSQKSQANRPPLTRRNRSISRRSGLPVVCWAAARGASALFAREPVVPCRAQRDSGRVER